MTKYKDQNKIKDLYLVNMESNFVTLLELLAQNKLIIVSESLISVEDCLEKMKLDLKSSVENSSDEFLQFVFNQLTIYYNKISKYEKEAQSLKASMEVLRNQFNNPQNLQNINDLSSHLSIDDVNQSKVMNIENGQKNSKLNSDNFRQAQMNLKQQLSLKQKQLKIQKQINNNTKIQIQSLNQLMKRLQNQNNKYTSKLYQCTQILSLTNKQNQQLKHKLNTFSIKQFQQNLEQVINKKQTILIENQNQRLKIEILMLNQKINYLQTKHQSISETNILEVNQLKALNEQKQKQLNESEMIVTLLQSKNNDLLFLNQQLKKTIQKINESIQKQQIKNFELQKQLNLKLQMSEQIQQTISNLQNQNQELVQRLQKQRQSSSLLISKIKNQKQQIQIDLNIRNQEIEQIKNKPIADLTKFTNMLDSLKQKQFQKELLVRKALNKIQNKLIKIKQSQNAIKKQIKQKFYALTQYFQRFVKEHLLVYKQKYLIYKRNIQQQQYQKYLILLKQFDKIRYEVERKGFKIGNEQIRIIQKFKQQNNRIAVLTKVKSENNFKQYIPSYVNRF